eukprot:707030-Amphidinium_carterae.1
MPFPQMYCKNAPLPAIFFCIWAKSGRGAAYKSVCLCDFAGPEILRLLGVFVAFCAQGQLRFFSE